MGMSRKAAGYYCRSKTYLEETAYGIKEQLCKLNLLKKCPFLKRKSLLDLYFKVILLSVIYGITIWGNCNNMDYIEFLQALHCLAGRLTFLIYHGIHHQN